MKVLLYTFICFLSSHKAFSWTNLKSKEAKGIGLEPGPLVIATKGHVWPKPQQQVLFDQVLTLEPNNFDFVVVGESCDILTQALNRYGKTIKNVRNRLKKASRLLSKWKRRNFRQDLTLSKLAINLTAPCEDNPYLLMDEQYWLRVNSPQLPLMAELRSASIFGILRGLETFVQLIWVPDDLSGLNINSADIWDFPRFPHRGLLIDTARHYLPIKVILSMLDGMVMNKLNVLHWHLVDDQSFPFESKTWPQLSAKGAFSPLHTYNSKTVADVIEYARLRGIRVIPEIDSPGHTRSWGVGYPELLTKCYDTFGNPDGSLGPINPLSNFTYSFMNTFIQEIVATFSDKFLHLGGDEVPFDCWLSNPEIRSYVSQEGISPEKLEAEYMEQVVQMAMALNSTPIVWQEVFDNGIALPENVVVHVWKDWIDYKMEMANVTEAGYQAIFSSCWYLDHLTSGGDWTKFYECDPSAFPGDALAHARVLGGEACMWAEVADASNVGTRVWPRACAVAEKLWSSATVKNIDSASKRLEEHACRMNLRGVAAQPPNGPGFCPLTS